MAGSLNKVILIGHVGRDPEIRTTQSGKKIASFSLATTQRWKDRNTGEQKEKTEWHRISIFSEGLVNVVERYIKRGSKLYIEGQLQTNKWQDQQGNDRYSTDIALQGFSSQLIMLDSRREGGGGGGYQQDTPPSMEDGGNSGGASSGGNNDYAIENLDDDIPF